MKDTTLDSGELQGLNALVNVNDIMDRGTPTPAKDIAYDIVDGKYKDAVLRYRTVIMEADVGSAEYLDARQAFNFAVPRISWDKCDEAGITYSGVVGLNFQGIDESKRAKLETYPFTLLCFTNATDTGCVVVVKVDMEAGTGERNDDYAKVVKQISDSYASGTGCKAELQYGNRDNALRASYDPHTRVNPRSTPWVLESSNEAIPRECEDVDYEPEDDGLDPEQLAITRKQMALEALRNRRFWEDVTDADVEEAIKGSAYEPLVTLLKAQMKPALPIAATLPKALVMAGSVMSRPLNPDPNNVHGKSDTNQEHDDTEPGPYGINDIEGQELKKRGIELARVRIMSTAKGQGCNIYALGVAEAGSGKDIGNVLSDLMYEENCLIASGCTAEGFLDALMYKPNGVLELSELKQYITPGNYQSAVVNTLTETFSKGSFHIETSHRGKGPARDAAYALPSVYANIQPKVLKRLFQEELMESGFWRRFVIAGWDNEVPRRANRVPEKENEVMLGNARAALKRFGFIRGEIEVPEGYLGELHKKFCIALKHEPGLLAAAKTLCDETGPRIALGLSVKDNSVMYPWTPTISEDAWKRAGTIVMWLLAHIERYSTGGMGDHKQQGFEDQMDKMLACIRKAGDTGITMRDIHRNIGRRKGSSKAMREACVTELLDRHQVAKLKQESMALNKWKTARYVAL